MPFLTRRNQFNIAVGVALAVRITIWAGTMIAPIPNEARDPISPLHANSAIDLKFYENSRAIYGAWLERFATAPMEEWWGIFRSFLSNVSESFIAGPLMSGLLAVFDYGSENPLPLAFTYLLVSCAIAVVWLHWLHQMGAGFTGLVILALLPGPLWLMLNVSSDLPFAALVTIFFFIFFSERRARQRYIWATGVAVVATLLRPHGVSLLLFLGLYAAILSPARTQAQKITIVAFLAVVGGMLLWLFSSYFSAYLQSSAKLVYFGYTTREYLAGIFPALPDGLNEIVSWTALPIAKLLYLVGIRPSYGDTLPLLILIRAAPGPILLAGLLYAFLRAPWAYRLLFAAFFAPVALGAAQDRYLLALTPLIVLFCMRFFQESRGALALHPVLLPPLPLAPRAGKIRHSSQTTG